MAITLAEAKVGMADKVVQQVIDTFRRESLLLDLLTFDDTVSPGTGGSTLVYGYQQLKTPSTAGFRSINEEYTANEAKREKKTATLKIFGGSYSVDRVIQQSSGAIDEMSFQLEQKIIGAKNLFHYTVINGDAAVDAESFDGLDVMLTGASTEYNASGAAIDLSTSVKLDDNYKAFLDELDLWLATLDGKPDQIEGNSKMIAKIAAVARRSGYFSQTEDAFGKKVDMYNGIPLVDLGQFYNGTTTIDCVGTYSATIESATVTGLTDLYAVKFGLDAFHGASLAGGSPINNYLPDMTKPGAVKTGDVEMVAAVVLKNSRKAGVFRRIKVA